MHIKLLITEGLRANDEFTVRDEIVIGRSQGDLQLKDQKVSNPHAKIFSSGEGLIEIEDLGSSNGTSVNGLKTQKSALKAGDIIGLGRSKILVVEITEPTVVSADKGSWQETLDSALGVAQQVLDGHSHVKKAEFRAFTPPIELGFTQGIQAGTKITMGFGPRLVGAHCPDGLISNLDAPPIAFEIFPNDQGKAHIRPLGADVELNGRPAKSGALKDGDRLSIGQTVIIIKTLETP